MKTIASILIALSMVILILALVQKNSNYMSVGSVVKKHFSVFLQAPIQFCAIFVVPALLSIAAILSNVVSDTLMEDLLVAVSIFFSVFFAVMSILCSMTVAGSETQPKEPTGATGSSESAKKLVEETFNCAMFESIISVAVLVLLICYQMLSFSTPWVKAIIQAIILYLVFLVITNMFVILKRLEKLFSERNGKQKKNNSE